MERYLKAVFADSNIDIETDGVKPEEMIDLIEGLIIIASRRTGTPIEKVLNKVIANIVDGKKAVIRIVKFQDRKGE